MTSHTGHGWAPSPGSERTVERTSRSSRIHSRGALVGDAFDSAHRDPDQAVLRPRPVHDRLPDQAPPGRCVESGDCRSWRPEGHHLDSVRGRVQLESRHEHGNRGQLRSAGTDYPPDIEQLYLSTAGLTQPTQDPRTADRAGSGWQYAYDWADARPTTSRATSSSTAPPHRFRRCEPRFRRLLLFDRIAGISDMRALRHCDGRIGSLRRHPGPRACWLRAWRGVAVPAGEQPRAAPSGQVRENNGTPGRSCIYPATAGRSSRPPRTFQVIRLAGGRHL